MIMKHSKLVFVRQVIYWTCLLGVLFAGIYHGVSRCWGNPRGAYRVWEDQGWFLKAPMDTSDFQWRAWREFVWILTGVFVLFSWANARAKKAWPLKPSECKQEYPLDDKHTFRVPLGKQSLPMKIFSILIRLLFLVPFHGSTLIFVWGVALISYLIAKIFKKHWLNPILSWIFLSAVLFASDYWSGFEFRAICRGLHLENVSECMDIAIWLDDHRGYLRWQTYFNITFCRLISFNMDYYWRLNGAKTSYVPKTEIDARTISHLPLTLYNGYHYFDYLYYPPLYIAGPILTFNSYVSQKLDLRSNQQKNGATWQYKLFYLARVYFWTCFLDIYLTGLHYSSYLTSGRWLSFESAEMGICVYFVLGFMFTKFLCIWRFFRAWALIDNIDTVDNMKRCFSNNHSFAQFWQSWHASMNKWTFRYIYVPLGGKRYQHFSVWVIFFFVGLWHNLSITWVTWALMNCIFFTGELVLMHYIREGTWVGDLLRKWSLMWHWLCGTAGACCIVVLMMSQLCLDLGFAWIPGFIRGYAIAPGSGRTLILMYIAFYCATHIQSVLKTRRLAREATERQVWLRMYADGKAE
eukprot:gnl/Trimastix_PCT/4471.p1 GENE.gnl/Trimastix_PCT/4471~~gnl/Trimastix_PCT/4471.p1  ORF type:complete len:578 (-),score=49.85 gnl/Trimastix_PCT/4471:70-1803(-)